MKVEELESFGLSRREALVYLALLTLGTAVVSDIAKKARINRSTAYVLLSSLARQGLVSISLKRNIRLYTAASPERLIQILEESAKKCAELLVAARAIVPELKLMYSGVGPKPRVQFFEDVEGIKTAYEDTLTATETIRALASIENMHATLPNYFPGYYQRRAQRQISIRAIFPDTPISRERIRHNKAEARETCLIPKSRYGFSPEINIYDNKVVFMSLIERFALRIESVELADALKKMFDLAWEEAHRLSEKIDAN